MKWSWKLGRLAGIDVYVHATFLLLIGWVLFAAFAHHGNLGEALGEVAFVLLLFGIIVLHELGHALAARRYGIQTRDITLLPIGGLARLERMPTDPRQELVVALAGPAVNVVLAVGLFLVLAAISDVQELHGDELLSGDFLNRLMWVNVVLVAFNMLPAFPMDGGRVLRALLAMRMDYVQATQIAAGIGQAMAFLFGLLGLIGHNPFLVFIALFVWLGAAQEGSMVEQRSALAGVKVSAAMITHFETLAPDDSLARAVEHVLAGFQHDFPVVREGQVIGMLPRQVSDRRPVRKGADDACERGHAAAVRDDHSR